MTTSTDAARLRPWQLTALVILAGALGNLSERLIRAYVADFMHINHWPVFNMADVFIVAGAGLLLLSTFRRRNTEAIS